MKKRGYKLISLIIGIVIFLTVFFTGCADNPMSFSKEELSDGLIRVELIYRKNWEIHPEPLIIAELTEQEKEKIVEDLSEVTFRTRMGRPKSDLNYALRLVYETTEVNFFEYVIECGLRNCHYAVDDNDEFMVFLNYYIGKYVN